MLYHIGNLSFLLRETFLKSVKLIFIHGRRWLLEINFRKDATLKELWTLIKQVNEDARKRSSQIEFTAW